MTSPNFGKAGEVYVPGRDSPMIKAIAIGNVVSACQSAEEEYCRRLLFRALARFDAPVWRVPSGSIFELASLVAQLAADAHLPQEAQILLLAHDQLLPAPGTFEKLVTSLTDMATATLAHECRESVPSPPAPLPQAGVGSLVSRCATFAVNGVVATAAWDNRCCHGDYLTLRGMERFQSWIEANDHQAKKTDHNPLVVVTHVGSLTELPRITIQRQAGAWVHDFSDYRTHARQEMLSLLPDDCTSLLDVGGGNGAFLQAAKKRFPLCRTVLVESSPLACSEAAGKVDRVLQGDFLEVRLDDERFSGIAFLDVLEHALEPLAMLMKAKQLLQPGGFVIASIPNVAHWSVIADLIEGRWDYAPAGIHCVTHLRFFTRHSIIELFHDAGFVIERWGASRLLPPPWFNLSPMATALQIDEESLSVVAWHCLARLE